ncbi:hypothetical protein [Bradyrhizobium canariense]|uniref:hypothetical protein n=1 Tax=Bradyrhizobium canariense TaxID=255045 RepID=UPI0011BA7D1F|nr:hypothetical protein [Bradyrhizobium canariense]
MTVRIASHPAVNLIFGNDHQQLLKRVTETIILARADPLFAIIWSQAGWQEKATARRFVR